MLVCVKTVESVIEEGEDPLPCVKHLRMIAEKVSKNIYKVDSLCKYDSVARKRAGSKGVDEFGMIHHNEIFTYFTYDNTVSAAGSQESHSKSGKFKSQAKKYSDIICTRYNSEEGCKLPCSFLHACMFVRPVHKEGLQGLCVRGALSCQFDCKVYKKSNDSK